MKIIISPDSYKNSMSSAYASSIIKDALLSLDDRLDIKIIEIGDGGEGTLEAINNNLNGKIINVPTFDAYLNEINAPICIANNTAIIECASSIGLELNNQLDIYNASSFGLGIQIKKALDYNVTKMMLCLGGSATNDGGIGMLKALGVEFLDRNNKPISNNVKDFINIRKIDISNLDKRIYEVDIEVACDVKNRLLGEKGASHIFGPQKGANKKDVIILDMCLNHFRNITKELFGVDMQDTIGGGAAGGLGATIQAYLRGRLKPGIEIVKEILDYDNVISDADLIITGEGSFDLQSLEGKACIGIASSAKKLNIPVYLFAGKADLLEATSLGITKVIPLTRQTLITNEILKNGPTNLRNAILKEMKDII